MNAEFPEGMNAGRISASASGVGRAPGAGGPDAGRISASGAPSAGGPDAGRKKRKWFWIIVVLILLGAAMSVVSESHLGGKGMIGGGNPEIGQINLVAPIFSSESILASFQLAERSEKMKVLILRVDSPGGFVASSQEIFKRIRQFRERRKIPVIVSVENLCASGAYYVSAAADTIIVNPGSQVGSIGVIVDLLNVRELMDKFGVGARTFKTGKFKDAGDPTKRLTQEQQELERKYFQGLIDAVLDQFVQDVAQSRRMSKEKVREIAHGGVFTGVQAVELGLADRVGNYVDAIEMAAAISGIDPVEAVATIIEPPDRRGFVERFLFGDASAINSFRLFGRISATGAPGADVPGSAALRPQVPASPTPADIGRKFVLSFLP